MSEDTKGVSNTPDESVSDVSQESQQAAVSDSGNQNTVQYHTHKKLLGQHKNTLAENEALKDRLQALENEKYEVEGNKDKLIESLKKQVADKDGKLKQTVGTVARSQAMNAIADEAVNAGCNSLVLVQKFLEDKIETLHFDENFNPDRDQVRSLIDEAKQSAPILFGKPAPGVANHNISGGGTANPKPNLKKMSMDELMKEWGRSES